MARKWFQLIVCLILLGSIGSGIWIHLSEDHLFASPTAVRPPFAQRPPPTPPKALTLTDIGVVEDGNAIDVFPPQLSVEGEPEFIPAEVAVTSQPGRDAVFSDDSRIEFVAGVIGYPVFSSSPEGYELMLTEFDPKTGNKTPGLAKTHPLLAAKFTDWPRKDMNIGTGSLSKLIVLFRLSGMKNSTAWNTRIRDHNTQVILDQGKSGFTLESEGETYLFTSFYLHALHPLETEIEIEFFAGAMLESMLPIRAGDMIGTPNWQLRILYAKSDDTTSPKTIQYWFDNPMSWASDRSLVITSWSHGNVANRFKCDFLSLNGEEILASPKHGSHPQVGHFAAKIPLEGIQALRVRHPEKAKRARLRLGPMPGMPEINREVTNLFDVRIPYAVLGENPLPTVCKVAQIENDVDIWPSASQEVYINRTVEDLWHTSVSRNEENRLPGFTPTRLELDRENFRIVSREPPFQWLHEWWDGVFR